MTILLVNDRCHGKLISFSGLDNSVTVAIQSRSDSRITLIEKDHSGIITPHYCLGNFRSNLSFKLKKEKHQNSNYVDVRTAGKRIIDFTFSLLGNIFRRMNRSHLFKLLPSLAAINQTPAV